MPKPKEVLSASEYSNYRNIRAVAWLFIAVGSLFVFGGLISLLQPQPTTPPAPGASQPLSPIMSSVLMFLGLFGVVGGIATLRGSSKVAPLIYVMAVPYLLAFPVGTILSFVMLKGLRPYLESRAKLRAAG